MPKNFEQRNLRVRVRIAQQAAKLMAENGIVDFSFAKRKAAHQLGVSDSNSLPGNQEIEAALREYHSLYQQKEHAELIQTLRVQALQVMKLLESFNPYLTGPVLSGSATRHVAISLSLYTESDKEVELFLMSRQIGYARKEKRIRVDDEYLMVPCFVLEGDPAMIEVMVMSPGELKSMPRMATESSISRAGLAQVRLLTEISGKQ